MATLNSCWIFACFLIFQKEVSCQCCGSPSKAATCQNVSDLLTSRSGVPLDNNKACLTIGKRGPLLLADTKLLEEMAHFNRERVTERIVHANGVGAFGYFVVTHTNFTKYCKASMFDTLGKKTKLVIRMSTPLLESGSCDNIQTFRGAAIKCYTDDGNLDLTCVTAPMFSIGDPFIFPSGTKAARRDCSSYLSNVTKFWDRTTLKHETLHMNLYLFTSKGMPDGYRHMDFFTQHTFRVVNKYGHPSYAKFHFLTDQGVRSLNTTYAASLCGSDPDYAKRDLFNNIAAGNHPSWTMCYQIMSYKQAEEFRWNPFDLTKIWPENEYPLHPIGKLILNRNPRNHFEDVEQGAFAPSHLVPGIEPSPDKVLQARLFAYADTQLYRLGVNHLQLPINRAKVKVNNNQRDGAMALCDNQGDNPTYYPNSYGQHVCPKAGNSKWRVAGDVARYKSDIFDYYTQPRQLWQKIDEKERELMVQNICLSASSVPRELKIRVLSALHNVHTELERRVGLCIDLE